MKLARLHGRIVDPSIGVWENAHAARPAKRLRKYVTRRMPEHPAMPRFATGVAELFE